MEIGTYFVGLNSLYEYNYCKNVLRSERRVLFDIFKFCFVYDASPLPKSHSKSIFICLFLGTGMYAGNIQFTICQQCNL